MTQTLDELTERLKVEGLSEVESIKRLHAAAMLAMVEATYAVVNQMTMPTPLYRLTYDEANHHLQFELLGGVSPVPAPNSLDVGLLDVLIAGAFREKIPVGLEGITGVGKTFTVEQFMKTVLPKENYRMLRLNANMSNVLQPYTEGSIENGLVRGRLKTREL